MGLSHRTIHRFYRVIIIIFRGVIMKKSVDSLEKSTDAGNQWTRINEDPFDGSAGVAEGIEFFDESFGFIGLQSTSGDGSGIFMTEDGGLSFTEI